MGKVKTEKGSKEYKTNRLTSTDSLPKMQKKCVDKGRNLF